MAKVKVLLIMLLVATLVGCGVAERNAVLVHQAEESYAIQNYHDSFKKLVKPARAGDPEAQYAIGYLYFFGKGVMENRRRAVYWFTLAAQQGHPQAQEALHKLHNLGNHAKV